MLRFAKPAALVLFLVAGAAWVYWMEGVAMRHRLDRGLAEHPATGAWYAVQKQRVAAEGGPVALWCGRVKRLVQSKPTAAFAQPHLYAVELDSARLLAGSAGEKDERGGLVYVSVYGYAFPSGEPVEGERWVFAVSRNADANNIAVAAVPMPPGA